MNRASPPHEPAATPSPYSTPELYDWMYDALAFDLPFWHEVGRAAGGPVLDLGCGTGRVLLPLLEAGVDADGVDRHEPMLERLRAKARERGLAVRVVRADMRDFTMPRRYERVLCAFNTFAHHDSTEDQLRTLRCVREHLEPGGALVLHLSYPSERFWLDPDGVPVLETETSHPLAPGTIRVYDTRHKDRIEQRQRSEIEVRVVSPAGVIVESHRFAATQRWVYRYELELLLRAAGFNRWEIFGGFEREPLERDDQEMITWAWKD